jgi:hypothetical protein
MNTPRKAAENSTRIITVVLMTLIVLFVVQMVLVRHTGLRVVLSVVLVAAMGATLGWLVAVLRRERADGADR